MKIGNLRISWERLNNGSYINYSVNNLNANWSTTADLELALNNSVLSTLINIRADYLSKFKFYEVNSQNEPIENSEFNKLINSPNPYQSKEDFLKQFEWYTICFGYVFQRPYGASGFTSNYLYNLYSPNITFEKELKRSLIQKKSDVQALDKLAFTYKDIDTDLSMTFSDVIPFYDQANGLTVNPLTSPSRIKSIRKQVDNINAAFDAQKISTETLGREMVFKQSMSNSMDNALPLHPDDKKDMEDKFQRYGLGADRNRTVILEKEMGWKSMHIPHSDLGFEEIIKVNANLISQNMQVPNEIYKAYTEGDTFENKKQAEIMFLQNVMQPRADNLANSWGSFFDIDVKASCEHLPSMQVIEEQKADRLLKISQAVRNLTQSGFSPESANQYLIDNGLTSLQNGN